MAEVKEQKFGQMDVDYFKVALVYTVNAAKEEKKKGKRICQLNQTRKWDIANTATHVICSTNCWQSLHFHLCEHLY